MSKPVTLFDELQLRVYKSPEIFKPELRRQLQSARAFILDESMSAFLADIGWAAYRARPEAVNEVMDDVRHLARLPHAVTWIEWDEKALAKRAREQYKSALNMELVPRRSGWLLMQHPTIDTAFQGLSFGIGVHNFGSEGQDELGMAPFAMTWRADDGGPLPWHPHPFTVDESGERVDLRGWAMSSIMTGLANYRTPMIGLKSSTEFYPDNIKAYEFRQLLSEQTGMMRYVLGLLATINDLPVGITKVAASRGFMAKGNYRRFLEHSVITLTVPADKYRKVAKQAVIGMQRRAHQVRGHWRNNWRKPGEKIWIHEHQRGDASRGFVTHSYEVTTKKDH